MDEVVSVLTDKEATEVFVRKKGKSIELEEKNGIQLTPIADALLKESGVVGERYAQVRALYTVEGVKYVIEDSRLIQEFKADVEALAQLKTGDNAEERKQKQSYDSILMNMQDAEAIEIRRFKIRTSIQGTWLNR